MTLILFLLMAPLGVVNLIFVLEIAFGLFPVRSKSTPGFRNAKTVVVIPAHNEATSIESTLVAVASAAEGCAQILVVADNCTDSTASIVRSYGIEVTERRDRTRRGKGFALDHARAHLRAAPPDCVIVLDADCTIDRTSICALTDACLAIGLPGQATYLLLPDREASPLVQISNFAFLIRNLVRQRGLQRLAGRVHLTGTGMAFPWPVFANAQLATPSIVEDLQLGLHLAARGQPPQLNSLATVWSASAREAETMVQRGRWEGGFLATASVVAPRELLRATVRGEARDIWAALDLFVPPTALLVIMNLLMLAVGGAIAQFYGGNNLPLLLLGASFIAVGCLIMLAWLLEGRPFVSPGALVTAPLYVLRKSLLYANLLRKGAPSEWQRTKRADE